LSQMTVRKAVAHKKYEADTKHERTVLSQSIVKYF
jgi:hypothetical protein